MALFGKDRDGMETQGALPAGIARREVPMGERDAQMSGPGGMDAFLGKGTKITGKLVFEGKGRIEGHVEGEISAQDTLTIGEAAVVNAKIVGTSIVIEGKVTGDVTASERVDIQAGGKLVGDIKAARFTIADGASFKGNVDMDV